MQLRGLPAASLTGVAVGGLAVLVLVFLLGSLDEGWALAAVPVASAISYVASWWVTTAVGDDGPAALNTGDVSARRRSARRSEPC